MSCGPGKQQGETQGTRLACRKPKGQRNGEKLGVFTALVFSLVVVATRVRSGRVAPGGSSLVFQTVVCHRLIPGEAGGRCCPFFWYLVYLTLSMAIWDIPRGTLRSSRNHYLSEHFCDQVLFDYVGFIRLSHKTKTCVSIIGVISVVKYIANLLKL